MEEESNQNQENTQSNNSDNKEYNFRAMREKYEKQLADERKARMEAEKQLQSRHTVYQDESDDDDDEPYVDNKRLNKKLTSFERNLEKKIDQRAEEKAKFLLDKEKQESWLRTNPDFFDILKHADKFAEKDPELAETILRMPEGFERQKLVYKTIKAMGLHQDSPKAPTMQEQIDQRKRSPYYQPTGISNAPYAGAGDFSTAGQKAAYTKMQELKSRLGI